MNVFYVSLMRSIETRQGRMSPWERGWFICSTLPGLYNLSCCGLIPLTSTKSKDLAPYLPPLHALPPPSSLPAPSITERERTRARSHTCWPEVEVVDILII